MKLRDWIELAVGTAAYLLTVFGGFLERLAPPLHPLEVDEDFALGLGSFAIAVVLLITIAAIRLAGRRVRPVVWFAVSLVGFIAFALGVTAYRDYERAHSFTSGPEGQEVTYIAGDTLTAYGSELRRRLEGMNEDASNTALMENSGPVEEASVVWPAASINRVASRLERGYVLLLLAMAIGLFFLIEGVLRLIPEKEPRV